MILFPICSAIFPIYTLGWFAFRAAPTPTPGLIIIILGFAFGITALVLWIYGMIDAYKTSEKINKGEI